MRKRRKLLFRKIMYIFRKSFTFISTYIYLVYLRVMNRCIWRVLMAELPHLFFSLPVLETLSNSTLNPKGYDCPMSSSSKVISTFGVEENAPWKLTVYSRWSPSSVWVLRMWVSSQLTPVCVPFSKSIAYTETKAMHKNAMRKEGL